MKQLAVIALGCALFAQPAGALVKPRHVDSLSGKVLPPYGFIATVVPQELSEVKDELDGSMLNDLSAFRVEAGDNWRFWIDRRSGGMALAEGEGIAWVPGAGNKLDPAASGKPSLEDLEAKARDFISRYPTFFRAPLSQLELDRVGSRNFGETDQFWNIFFNQRIDGVPVDTARVVLRLSHGNLVQFGVDRVVPPSIVPKSSAPILTASQARNSLSNYIDGLQKGDTFSEDGLLIWVPRGVDETGPYTGPIGGGWEAALIYRFNLKRDGELGEWLALVDARTGDVLRFVDSNDYAKVVVKGGVYTLTNCSVPPATCVPGSATEVAAAMPNARLNFVGAVCSGDGCYTNESGAYEYPPLATASSTSLDGKYFTIVDTCGAIAGAAAAPAGIDLGTSDPNPPLNTNTDCAPATRQSPPNTGPTSGGNGDTHSSRNCFLHLNLINQKARVYLPANDWLKGEEGTIGNMQASVNGPPACNALWSGNDTGMIFFRSTPALSCNNTGEIPDVFLHEWGHGLDNNDATGGAPESSTGEAMGDSFALLQGQHSCIGIGFSTAAGPWGYAAGYGTGSRLCSGVRDIDYTRFCTHGAGEGCTPPPDPDMVNGSHSGVAPDLALPDAGTPARWDTMLTGFPGMDGKSNFYNCGGPESLTGCAGALNHGCHCESLIASQANWDLAKRFITTDFGGFIYNTATQRPREVSGWQYMDRLWYLTRDLASSAYSVTGSFPAGTTHGCGVTNWFSTYRFIDDDNGNLADGTPNADDIFSAFNLHAMACGAAGDASNQSSGCPALVQAPTLSACDTKAPVQLNWTPSTGAAKYRILRNTVGCEFGFTPVATVDGAQTYFEDTEAAEGFPVYYTVQPVSSNASCYGVASNCIAVTPTSCAAVPLAAPSNLALTTPASNQVGVSWDAVAGAVSYKVFRKDGDCASTDPYQAIGVVQGPSTSFLDAIGLQGGLTYAYQVVAADASCASCTSPPSACQSATVTGTCAVAPNFFGVFSAVSGTDGQCHVTVNWIAGTPVCGSSLTYSVYRSTDPNLLPSPGNLIASGLTGISYADFTVANGRYYYIVRATDVLGNTDTNLIRVSAIAVGATTPGTFSDNAGDSGTAKFIPSPYHNNNTWTARMAGGNPGRVYATTAAGQYARDLCIGLESPTLYLGTGSTLSFSTMYDMEASWDGAYVDVSTELGGFQDWTKLNTIAYPGVMGGPLGSPACGGPGFDDGAPVFTGTLPAYQTFSGSLSAYDGQAVRIRFLFSSDPATVGNGWFIDNVSVTNALIPGQCLKEVSGTAATLMDLFLNGSGNLDFVFEDLGAQASAYNVYEGTLAAPFSAYSHEVGFCHNTTTAQGVPASGRRTWSDYVTAADKAYFLINAVNATTEGILGLDSKGNVIPLPNPSCGPMP